MLYSILQIIAFQALFLLVYDLFLKRETFFNYNRAYLIITSVLSVVLPFIKFSELKTIATKDVVIHLPEVFIGIKTPTVYDIQIAEQAGIVLEQPQTPIWQVVAVTGIVIATLIFLVKIIKLYWLKHKNPKRWQGNVLIVKLMKSSAAFSFFNTIFLGERIAETEKPTIYEHELVHIKEYHTLDLLFFELLRIVFWFNPLVYIYQNRVKELHEYIADAKAIKQNGKSEYYQSLLNQVFDVNNVSFTNTFFKKSLIKKRIVMLQKSKSKQLNLLKYTLLLPLVFGMLIYTSTEVRAQQKTEAKQELNQELTDEELMAKYHEKILEMKKNGATFFEISDYAGIGKKNEHKYLPSRNEYLKFKAFMKYIADGMIQRKSEDGTLTQSDVDSARLMQMDKFKTYEEFRAFKNTKEEKERWELNTQDGILKLFVEDVANKTKEETKRYNGLLKQLENDDYFNKLIVTDGKSTLVLDSYISNKGEEIIKEEIESVEVPFSVVEETPTTIECKHLPSNKERKNCMNRFVNKHIAINFNTSIADSLSPGKKRIFVGFKIDKAGFVKDIKARGPSEALEAEAKRVIATLPQFIPGKQKGRLVVVPFSIPIVFEVKGDTNLEAYTNPNIDQVTKSHNELVTQRNRVLKNSSKENPVVIQLNNQIDSLKKELKKSLNLNSLENFKKDKATISDNEKQMITYLQEELNKQNRDLDILEEISFSSVEISPTHPSCLKLSSDIEKRKCTSNAVNTFVGKNFNTNIANSLDIPVGKQRISTQFTINKQGNVTNIKARGPHPKLEEEAKRVLKLLPIFNPGKENGKVIDVLYDLPIVFQIADSKKD